MADKMAERAGKRTHRTLDEIARLSDSLCLHAAERPWRALHGLERLVPDLRHWMSSGTAARRREDAMEEWCVALRVHINCALAYLDAEVHADREKLPEVVAAGLSLMMRASESDFEADDGPSTSFPALVAQCGASLPAWLAACGAAREAAMRDPYRESEVKLHFAILFLLHAEIKRPQKCSCRLKVLKPRIYLEMILHADIIPDIRRFVLAEGTVTRL